jgi:hypothetical protein
MGERKSAWRILVGKPEGKRPLGMPRSTRENNIKMALQEIDCLEWNGLIWLVVRKRFGLL